MQSNHYLIHRAKRDKQTRHNFNSMRRVRPEETTRRYIEAFNRAFEKHRIENHSQSRPTSNSRIASFRATFRVAVLIAFLCHGLFILTARYRLSYDAYTHMLFADHYARDWFSLWETRWYAGFTVVSYPPLTHQLMALFVPFIGFDAAFALILWCVVTVYPLAVYAFSRIFIGKTASSYAALASAILLPIYVTAYIFGQLPFLTATLFALLGSAALARYLREPSIRSLALAVSLVATSMAAHHATLLVQPFLIIAITVSQMNRQNLRALILRLTLFTIIAIPATILVIWPFWQWGLAQTMQTPIDHLSRHNFLTDPSAQLVFFWPMYGPLVAVIPFVFHKWPFRFWGLIFSFSLLFLLGLGGTSASSTSTLWHRLGMAHL